MASNQPTDDRQPRQLLFDFMEFDFMEFDFMKEEPRGEEPEDSDDRPDRNADSTLSWSLPKDTEEPAKETAIPRSS